MFVRTLESKTAIDNALFMTSRMYCEKCYDGTMNYDKYGKVYYCNNCFYEVKHGM